MRRDLPIRIAFVAPERRRKPERNFRHAAGLFSLSSRALGPIGETIFSSSRMPKPFRGVHLFVAQMNPDSSKRSLFLEAELLLCFATTSTTR
jgi:hypothetical protein